MLLWCGRWELKIETFRPPLKKVRSTLDGGLCPIAYARFSSKEANGAYDGFQLIGGAPFSLSEAIRLTAICRIYLINSSD